MTEMKNAVAQGTCHSLYCSISDQLAVMGQLLVFCFSVSDITKN